MTNTTTDAAEARALHVIQADRDAAADYCISIGHPAHDAFPVNYREGNWDHAPLAQAFARHRLATAEAASGAVVTAATATDDQLRRIQLLADVELHLKSCRIFLTSREKMHPCGVELHDELLANVTAAIKQEGRNG